MAAARLAFVGKGSNAAAAKKKLENWWIIQKNKWLTFTR